MGFFLLQLSKQQVPTKVLTTDVIEEGTLKESGKIHIVEQQQSYLFQHFDTTLF